MKTLLISLFMILTSISVYAEDIFPDRDIRELRVISADAAAESALIQDAEGTEAEILTGDTIGTEKGVVTKIDSTSITIRTGKTKTGIPVIYGFEEQATTDNTKPQGIP